MPPYLGQPPAAEYLSAGRPAINFGVTVVILPLMKTNNRFMTGCIDVLPMLATRDNLWNTPPMFGPFAFPHGTRAGQASDSHCPSVDHAGAGLVIILALVETLPNLCRERIARQAKCLVGAKICPIISRQGLSYSGKATDRLPRPRASCTIELASV